jgi:hypothetical protein
MPFSYQRGSQGHEATLPPRPLPNQPERRILTEERSSDSSYHASARKSDRKYSLSSYEHPYDIRPPDSAHRRDSVNLGNARLDQNGAYSTSEEPRNNHVGEPTVVPPIERRQGILAEVMDWYSKTRSGTHELPSHDPYALNDRAPSGYDSEHESSTGWGRLQKGDSAFSQCTMDSELLDEDDPRITGKESSRVDDPEDLERHTLRQMDYKARRKHIQRIRIQFNISCKL